MLYEVITGADLYHFSTSCSMLSYNPIDSVNTIKNYIVNRSYGGGTEFNSIFRTLQGKYDRVFVISDMQGSDTLLRGSSYQSYIRITSYNVCYTKLLRSRTSFNPNSIKKQTF